ncbi:MAG: DUF6171 family protein [Eubacteriales bacterium]|jgi:hypothetical protein
MASQLYGRPPCRRCLLEEIDRDGAYRTVVEYIASLDKSVRTDEAEYRRRLAVCRSCEHLNEGICAACGCFAEVRAAKRAQTCPDVPSRW